MRARRVRFTKPSIRADHPRATKTRDGITQYRRNTEGRHAQREAIGEQRRRQQSLCFDCQQWLDLADAKFLHKEFRDGVENPVG
jgi:hypothetical protein